MNPPNAVCKEMKETIRCACPGLGEAIFLSMKTWGPLLAIVSELAWYRSLAGDDPEGTWVFNGNHSAAPRGFVAYMRKSQGS